MTLGPGARSVQPMRAGRLSRLAPAMTLSLARSGTTAPLRDRLAQPKGWRARQM